MKLRLSAAIALGASLIAPRLAAQTHAHNADSERLGTVHLATSCAPAAVPAFDRAVALLHSFEFGAAIEGFQRVLRADSTCAMAWWGIALSQWTNPMVPNIRPAALLERGRRAADAASRLNVHATERERGYVAAVMQLYSGGAERSQDARVTAYEQAMAALVSKYPEDREARIFHAIALAASASPADKTYEKQLRAGALLEQLFAAQPDHPGLAHYIIHSYDVPALAARATVAAQRYAGIAPSASHALHMPSHTFTRVGMWKESAETNQRSMDVAIRDSAIAEALHAADYRVYAHLQMRQDSQAAAILGRIPALAARFDPNVVRGAAPGSAGVYALAAMPARFVIERDAWTEAAELRPVATAFPYAEAVTYFARALGAARSGRPALATSVPDSLDAIRARLAATSESYWAEQVRIQRLGAQAWLDFAAGRREQGLATMREAARSEDATEKAAVTPGPIAPARELLGDMLLAIGRPREALAEYRAGLQREPNRYRMLSGAARAAAAQHDTAAAAAYGKELKKLTGR